MIGLLLSKPRKAFGAPLNLVDAPASELWASNAMEARPFKDANYDLKRAQLETGIQAVPRLKDAAIQVSAGGTVKGCSGSQSNSFLIGLLVIKTSFLQVVAACHVSALKR